MGRILQLIGVLVFVGGLWWTISSDLPLLTLCLLPGPVALLLIYFGGKMVASETTAKRHAETIEAIKGRQ